VGENLRPWPTEAAAVALSKANSILRGVRLHVNTIFDNVYTFVYHKNSTPWLNCASNGTKKKNAANIKNHGIDFLDAALIFENPTIEVIDDREDYGELRCIALGLSGETVLHVVYTRRSENVVRIISARKANRRDAEKYYCEIFA
jgi:hypothetical protein